MNKKGYMLVLLVVVILASGVLLFYKTNNKNVADLKSITEYSPEINPEEFSTIINNPYFTLTPGKKTVYEAKTEDGVERIEFYVTHEKKTVLGVETVVVWDRAWRNGSLIEDTKDWFAEDKDGNVWYFGEDTVEMSNGKITSHEGSWEAGVNGALPGIIMKALPVVGDSYREEYYKGEAEDKADILSVSESVSVPFGSYTNCLKTKNYTDLEPDVVEYKYYCKEVGNTALEIDGDEKAELIKVEYNAAPSQSGPSTKTNTMQKAVTSVVTPPSTVPQNSGENTAEIETQITEEQAEEIALARVPGKVTDIAIEEKFGKTVYVVEINATNGGETDVIIDINTGEVLGVE